VNASLILAVIVVSAARVRGGGLSSCGQEITRCLVACRAVASRRLADDTRDAHMARTTHRSVASKSSGNPTT
jgi:hypothetical protein